LAATVFWLLCVVCTLAADGIALTAWLLSRFAEARPIQMVQTVSLFVALVTGIVAVLMVPIVLRVRPTRPPSSALHLTYLASGLAILCAVFFR
jgi:hypothetical protein